MTLLVPALGFWPEKHNQSIIPFSCSETAPVCSYALGFSKASTLSLEIKKMSFDPSSGLYSHLFLAEKAIGSYSPCMDLPYLNYKPTTLIVRKPLLSNYIQFLYSK